MGVGTFLLARRLGLRALACTAAALSMTFCPYNQWYLELIGNGYCLTPFLFLPLLVWALVCVKPKPASSCKKSVKPRFGLALALPL